ncbi:type I restriction enzyme, S subunit [Pseudomonas sp. IT-194MI4]|uniref:restriction endonuclease subunit S n=1 Tax=Pseudomonas sp. IT-194MI4 TaxID=3026443 RepID=UPI0039DF7257
MSSEWSSLTLKKAGIVLIDCDHRTPPAIDEGYPYIAIPQLKNGHIALDGARRISQADYIDWTKKLKPQANDVIVVRRCNSGDSAHVPAGLDCAIGQNLVVLRANGDRVLPSFLRWLLKGPEWWGQVSKFINVGAVFDSLRCRDIPNFELTIPPLDQQAEIASFLGAIDDRITLLRETNATLEAIAQALFKSWFVDFDPVRANAEGLESEDMETATAALFPDSFEESDLELVPRGWKVGVLGDVADTARKQIQPHAMQADSLYVGLEHIPRQSLGLDSWGTTDGLESAKSCFEKGDILFGKLRPYFHKIVIAPFAGVCSTDILVCKAKEADYYGFVAMQLFSTELVAYADRLSNGAKMPRVNWKDLSDYVLVIPPAEVAAAYSDLVQPLFDQITANIHQAQTLTQLRETLLPRLISGQLPLPEAETLVKAANV